MKKTNLIVMPAMILFGAAASAQNTALDNPPGATLASFESFLSSREFILAMGVIGFGVIIIVIQFLLLRTVVEKHISEIFKIFTVTLIIISTLLLIAVGFNSEQIAPALGLFGTIAGYLLAKSENSVDRNRSTGDGKPDSAQGNKEVSEGGT